MTAQELKTGETSVEWFKDFHDIVRLVDEKWQRDPPKIPEGPPKIDKNTELLLEGTLVRTKLLEPILVLGKKIHGKFRTGDIKWDPKVHIIKKLIISPKQLPTYLLDGSHGRLGVSRCAYTRKELQVILINEKPLPDSVIKGQLERYVPEKILKHRTRKDIFQIHEIARNIMYYLDQLAKENYWKAVVDYKNNGEELERAIKKYLDINKAVTEPLYKKKYDLVDKKEKAFEYQVEIEKILLQGGFVYKKNGIEKNRILDNIRMLANGLDPYEIQPWFGEPEEPIWQSNYWGDEDPDDPTNWQSEYSEDPSNSDEDPDYPYLESVEWI
ncbi:hypothetical protein RclHR1_07310013 [Rhizophagus clarus]|uniref:Uncharacterized protein n=1 Tax=Rhizophagus clarus TaxID=94130 RepID=A0A2Z6RY95_9GLOM|nr:hypothetical protein RclHR1_07310013 [Rhizophagus clarus]